MSNNFYLPLHPGDYLADTVHLSAAEHGAYLLLIMNYWQRAKPLPLDDRKLRSIARMSEDEWSASKDAVLEFFVERDGLLYHKRIEGELDRAREKSVKARDAGRRSAASKRIQEQEPADDQRSLNERSTSVEQTLNERSTDAQRPLNERSTNQVQVQEQIQEEDIHTCSPAAPDIARQFRLDLVDVYRQANLERTPDGGYVHIWLARGYDPRICLAVVAEGLARQKRFLPPKYFDQPIADAHVAPKGQARKANGGPVVGHDPPKKAEASRDEWRTRLERFARSQIWMNGWGPRPGFGGCEAPKDLIDEILKTEAA